MTGDGEMTGDGGFICCLLFVICYKPGLLRALAMTGDGGLLFAVFYLLIVISLDCFVRSQ